MAIRALHDLLVSNAYRPIALTRTAMGHFSLNGTIDGKPAVFIVDTGASNTVVGRRTADSFGFDVTHVDDLGGGLGVSGARTERAPVQQLQLDGFDTHLDSVFVMDIDAVNQALVDNGSEAVDGVVGGDVLMRSEAIIDCAGAMLYLKEQRSGSA